MSKRKIIKTCDTQVHRTASPKPLKLFLGAAPFLAGLYYEWMSGLACIFLIGYLWYCVRNTGSIRIFRSLSMLTYVLLPVVYGVSVFWAVDSGMALMGMLKFLPIPLFAAAAGQLEREQRKGLLDYIPVSGAVMTVLSWGLSLIPGADTFFIVNHRLAGFFQYPNTFALYLLVGMNVLLTGESRGIILEKKQWVKMFVNLLILLAGIVLTGSRTGFVLLVVNILCYYFILKDRRVRMGLAGVLILLAASVGIYVLVTGNTSSVGRYLTASLSSSTFLGRLLYFKDALPVIARRPFGLGYMGYFFSQGSFQTGVYSVMNVHNELLQFLLDIGWIPTGLMIWTAARGFLRGGLREKMIIAVIVLHSMMDFHLQFIAIFFILSAAVDLEEKNGKEFAKKGAFMAGTAAVVCVSLCLATSSALYYLKMYPASVLVYPGNTSAWMELLTEQEDAESMDETADRILELNAANPLANNAKARAAYSKGDFQSVISYKKQALEYYRYSLEEYLDYFDMLYVGYQLYLENGDADSAAICARCMQEIPVMLKEVEEETDSLAYKISDKPELKLPNEYALILQMI